MNRKKTTLILAAALALTSAASGCGRTGYEDFVFPEQEKSTLAPVDSIYRDNSGDDLTPVKEKTNRTVRSSDGLCVIECKDRYTAPRPDRRENRGKSACPDSAPPGR